MSILKLGVMLWCPDQAWHRLSHVVSSEICLSFMSFLQGPGLPNVSEGGK